MAWRRSRSRQKGPLLAVSDSDLIVADADPGAVRRHRLLFRAVQRRKNPPLRRTDVTVTDEAAAKRAVKAAALGNAMQ